ncbi:hypothetical protein TIFTF001_013626 [Ficus carica]|uniref:Uncharacterized protein n=1 Tax=Ficus carica TaxID=3494 RepID=A0AA88AEM3_FICCA|nr:hypothetical protein TIFTF001_013626 [Ficus carica]
MMRVVIQELPDKQFLHSVEEFVGYMLLHLAFQINLTSNLSRARITGCVVERGFVILPSLRTGLLLVWRGGNASFRPDYFGKIGVKGMVPTFRIPHEICDDLDATVRRFWWTGAVGVTILSTREVLREGSCVLIGSVTNTGMWTSIWENMLEETFGAHFADQLHERSKMFLWRLVIDCLPTKDLLDSLLIMRTGRVHLEIRHGMMDLFLLLQLQWRQSQHGFRSSNDWESPKLGTRHIRQMTRDEIKQEINPSVSFRPGRVNIDVAVQRHGVAIATVTRDARGSVLHLQTTGSGDGSC